MRYAIINQPSGLVFGEGATEAEAWAEAQKEADGQSMSFGPNDICTPYDPREERVGFFGGIVCLRSVSEQPFGDESGSEALD